MLGSSKIEDNNFCQVKSGLQIAICHKILFAYVQMCQISNLEVPKCQSENLDAADVILTVSQKKDVTTTRSS